MSNDETGYCKPPLQHRFKKGQSGNARGRPRKTEQKLKIPSDTEILRKIQNETVIVDGLEMTKRELELRVLQKKAMSGDIPAIKLLNELSAKAGVAGGTPRRQGVLRLGPKVTVDEWEKEVQKNQAQYRENRRDDGADD